MSLTLWKAALSITTTLNSSVCIEKILPNRHKKCLCLPHRFPKQIDHPLLEKHSPKDKCWQNGADISPKGVPLLLKGIFLQKPLDQTCSRLGNTS